MYFCNLLGKFSYVILNLTVQTLVFFSDFSEGGWF
jgi:hypothetical protein